MHPDVCRFISDRIYEGRLTSYVDCAKQGTDLGTGLRWLRVDHEDCATESVEEAEAVAGQISALLGRNWTDQDGEEHPIGVDDVMVVAPYNDQVRLLREHLDADPATRGVQVGTVDKFQGRQAPVVLFTMTSSSAEDMPRGTEFLFSRNRLNVAISRAQCLAYLVCTEELLRQPGEDGGRHAAHSDALRVRGVRGAMSGAACSALRTRVVRQLRIRGHEGLDG